MRISVVVAGCLLPALLLAAGCGPAVSREELGTVVFEVPKVPGAEGPYKMPELGPAPPPSASEDAVNRDHAGH